MSYLFERYDKFINQGITMHLLTMAHPFSKSFLIGHTSVNFYNYCLYTTIDKDGMLYLDVGISYFLIQFWKRIFEYKSLLSRYMKIVAVPTEQQIMKQQCSVTKKQYDQSQVQNTQGLDYKALSISTLNNTVAQTKNSQEYKHDDTQALKYQSTQINKKLQTDPQSSLEYKVQEQTEQLKMLLAIYDQNVEKIQLQQRQIDFLLNENTNLKKQVNGDQNNKQQLFSKTYQQFDAFEASETPSPVGIQNLKKDINFDKMMEMLKCSQTFE